MSGQAPELNATPEIRKKTAAKLGISEKQLEEICRQIKEKKPAYHYGYDYNLILAYLIKNKGAIKI